MGRERYRSLLVRPAISILSDIKLFAGSFFRAAVPQDIVANAPNPALWGLPSAALEPELCDPIAFFKDHSIIFGPLNEFVIASLG